MDDKTKGCIFGAVIVLAAPSLIGLLSMALFGGSWYGAQYRMLAPAALSAAFLVFVWQCAGAFIDRRTRKRNAEEEAELRSKMRSLRSELEALQTEAQTLEERRIDVAAMLEERLGARPAPEAERSPSERYRSMLEGRLRVEEPHPSAPRPETKEE